MDRSGGVSLDRRSTVARLLIAFALIVQIWAPVGSSRMVIAQAFDPLADVVLCHVEPDAADGVSLDGSASHGYGHCDLCQLATNVGFTPSAPTVVGLVEPHGVAAAHWAVAVEAIVDGRILARIRGRAPPALV